MDTNKKTVDALRWLNGLSRRVVAGDAGMILPQQARLIVRHIAELEAERDALRKEVEALRDAAAWVLRKSQAARGDLAVALNALQMVVDGDMGVEDLRPTAPLSQRVLHDAPPDNVSMHGAEPPGMD